MWTPGNTLKLPQRTIGGSNVNVRQGTSLTTINAEPDSKSFSHPVLPLPDQEVGEWYRKNKLNIQQTDWERVQTLNPIDGGGGPVSNSSSNSSSVSNSPSPSNSNSMTNSVSDSASASNSDSLSPSPSLSPSYSGTVSISTSVSLSPSVSNSFSNSMSTSPSMPPSLSPSL